MIKDGDGAVLYSTNGIYVPGYTPTRDRATLSFPPLVAQTITIEENGLAGRLAMDNIRFGEPVAVGPKGTLIAIQ